MAQTRSFIPPLTRNGILPKFFAPTSPSSIIHRTQRYPFHRVFSTSCDAAGLDGTTTPYRIAIVGSGPAGFYTAKYLLRAFPNAKCSIDMFDQFATPFGLVRYGVAPDHPEVKNVQNDFEDVWRQANSDSGGNTNAANSSTPTNGRDVADTNESNFRFFGNVIVGDLAGVEATEKSSTETDTNAETSPSQVTVPLPELKQNYDVVVLSTGPSGGRKLLRSGSFDAFDFVKWYNGYPATSDVGNESNSSSQSDISLRSAIRDAKRATVIGLGNVALDVARILVTPHSPKIMSSDIIESARTALLQEGVNSSESGGRISWVDVVGRRGAIQNQFGNKELREMINKEEFFKTIIDPIELQLSLNQASKEEVKQLRAKKRQIKMLEDMANQYDEVVKQYDQSRQVDASAKVVQLRFLCQPKEVVRNEDDSSSKFKLLVNRTQLVGEPLNQTAEETVPEERIELPTDIVLESVGFQFRPIDSTLSDAGSPLPNAGVGCAN
jgi:adrenodoxin-NADP+ reductase